MAYQFESFVAEKVLDVAARTTKEIIDANYISSLREQVIAKMRSKKSRSARDQYSLFKMHYGSRR